MKTLATIETSYGIVQKIPHDINGNPRYFIDKNIIVTMNLSRYIDNPKYRRAVWLRQVKGGYTFSTYNLEEHLGYIKNTIEKLAKEKEEKKYYITYLVARDDSNHFEIIDTLFSKDFPNVLALRKERQRIREEYQLCYRTYCDFSWRVKSNLPKSLRASA